jgi:RimJ/RimL family protein N-acetyltransferase
VAREPVVVTIVRLRDVREADLAVFFEQQLDPEATRMAAFPARDREAFVAHWERILVDEEVTARAIVADGAVAGNIVSFRHDGRTEVGYWLGREFWGRGIASRALAEFVRVVDERPLHAAVAKHNIPSMRVLEKCGFVRRGEEDGMAVFELPALRNP